MRAWLRDAVRLLTSSGDRLWRRVRISVSERMINGIVCVGGVLVLDVDLIVNLVLKYRSRVGSSSVERTRSVSHPMSVVPGLLPDVDMYAWRCLIISGIAGSAYSTTPHWCF